MKNKFSLLIAVAAGLLLLNWAFDFFVSDAAVRFAQQIRDGVRAHHASPGQRYTLELTMRSFPQGCADNYSVQFSKDASIVVWCKDGQGRTVGSYSTTYHGNWVSVPQQFNVERAPGRPLTVELEAAEAGKHIVVNVR